MKGILIVGAAAMLLGFEPVIARGRVEGSGEGVVTFGGEALVVKPVTGTDGSLVEVWQPATVRFAGQGEPVRVFEQERCGQASAALLSGTRSLIVSQPAGWGRPQMFFGGGAVEILFRSHPVLGTRCRVCGTYPDREADLTLMACAVVCPGCACTRCVSWECEPSR